MGPTGKTRPTDYRTQRQSTARRLSSPPWGCALEQRKALGDYEGLSQAGKPIDQMPGDDHR